MVAPIAAERASHANTVTRPRVPSNQRAPKRGSRSLSCFAIGAVARAPPVGPRLTAARPSSSKDSAEIAANASLRGGSCGSPTAALPALLLIGARRDLSRKGGAVALPRGPRSAASTFRGDVCSTGRRTSRTFPAGPRPPCGVLVNRAAAAKVWAERRQGELLAAMRSMAATGETRNFRVASADSERPRVTHDQSSEWQKLQRSGGRVRGGGRAGSGRSG